MNGVLLKTAERTARFIRQALAWRAPERPYAAVAWGLVAGAVWLAISLAGEFGLVATALAGLYFFILLAATCAIDARYGIIPDSIVAGIAAGGAVQTYLIGPTGLLERGFEAAAVFAAASLFRASYRWIRGFDGLGFGDVKFVAAGTFWIGVEGMPGLLLIAVLSALVSLLILRAQGHELHGNHAISFGPHLALGLWLTWVAGALQ
jgi:leader peptidase (prepilin peptidase) / N-methyltransferase